MSDEYKDGEQIQQELGEYFVRFRQHMNERSNNMGYPLTFFPKSLKENIENCLTKTQLIKFGGVRLEADSAIVDGWIADHDGLPSSPTVFSLWGVEVDKAGGNMAQFSLADFPGNCGMCIFTGAEVFSDYQRQGIGTQLSLLAQVIASALGYTIMYATVTMENEAQRSIMNKTGWTSDIEFQNARTVNDICVYYVELDPPVDEMRDDDDEDYYDGEDW